VGGREKFQKQQKKKKLGWGRGENKVPRKKKTEIRSGLRKGKEKK
jgi:hypothetical protein